MITLRNLVKKIAVFYSWSYSVINSWCSWLVKNKDVLLKSPPSNGVIISIFEISTLKTFVVDKADGLVEKVCGTKDRSRTILNHQPRAGYKTKLDICLLELTVKHNMHEISNLESDERKSIHFRTDHNVVFS